MPQCLVDRKFY
ncbi:hypothetical protein VCCP1050_3003, partial [Vibrio cholerae CP1050(23)]